MSESPRQGKNGPEQKPKFKLSFSYILLILLGIVVFNAFLPSQRPDSVPYSEFKDQIRQGIFQKVWLTSQYAIGERKDSRAMEGTEENKGLFRAVKTVSTRRPLEDRSLLELLDESGIPYEIRVENTAFRDFLLTWILPLGLMFLLWSFLFRKMGPGADVLKFGKNKAKLQAESDNKTKFRDVAGQEEPKEELKEIIEFLQFPKKFTSLGGKLPKGILLVGPPGTGKTLLARAVAGEAEVPFFNISGSDFVEMFVGVGAARVRDLFKQAKSKAPCIIFVDELDAIGKSRGMNPMGGHDEREQTLNQLLVEMDGFDTKTGVIIMAATNRPETLDQALLRAGRFDRHVVIGKPNLQDRIAILKLHSENIKHVENIEFNTIGKRTPGLVGADLANIVNEAALLAARRDKKAVEMADFEEAVDRTLTGLEKKNQVMNKKEKEIVAYHESGHALVAALVDSEDKVHKISIIPTSIGALGYTLQLPTEDRYLMTKDELIKKVDVLLGGRAAEKIVFSEVSTGASDDLRRATDISRSMITQYGMGEALGPTTLPQDRSPFFLDPSDMGGSKSFSEDTARKVDEEIQSFMKARLECVVTLLKKNKKLLENVSKTLLEKEVMEAEEFQALIRAHKGEPVSAPSPAPKDEA